MMRRLRFGRSAAMSSTLLLLGLGGCTADGVAKSSPDRTPSRADSTNAVVVDDQVVLLKRHSEAERAIANAVSRVDPDGAGPFASTLSEGGVVVLSARYNVESGRAWRGSQKGAANPSATPIVLNDVIHLGDSSWLHAPNAPVGSRECWFDMSSTMGTVMPPARSSLAASLSGVGYADGKLFATLPLPALTAALPISIQRVFNLNPQTHGTVLTAVTLRRDGTFRFIDIPGEALADSFKKAKHEVPREVGQTLETMALRLDLGPDISDLPVKAPERRNVTVPAEGVRSPRCD